MIVSAAVLVAVTLAVSVAVLLTVTLVVRWRSLHGFSWVLAIH